MRNIISMQLEQLSCSTSLMVYSKCLMNIKMKILARKTDLSAAILAPKEASRGTVVTAKTAKYQRENCHQLM